MKTLLYNKADFSDYLEISNNVRDTQFNKSILSAQDLNLREILNDDLLSEMLDQYAITKNIINITIGVNTIIEVSDTSDVQTNGYIYLSDIVGTVGNILNGIRHQIIVIDSTTFSINIDTSSLLYNSAGVASRYLSKQNEDLRNEATAFVAYTTDVYHASAGKIQSTESGYVQKITEQSAFIDNNELNAYIAMQHKRAALYKKRLVSFLEDNKDVYTLWANDEPSATILSQSKNIVAIPLKTKYNTRGLY